MKIPFLEDANIELVLVVTMLLDKEFIGETFTEPNSKAKEEDGRVENKRL